MALMIFRTELGDPGQIRAESRRLGTRAQAMREASARLLEVSTKGVWDAPSGVAFASRVGEVPQTLNRLASTLEETTQVIVPYADLLAESQRVMKRERETYDAYVTESDRLEAQLEGTSPEDPDYARVDGQWRDAANEREFAKRRHQREGEQATRDEEAVARRLDDIAASSTDPWGYDFFEGMSDLGTSAAVNNVVVDFVPALKWVSLLKFADPIGQFGLRALYGQGSYAAVGKSAMRTTLDVVKLPAGPGAKLDDAARTSARASETAAAKAAHAAPAGASGSRATRLRDTARAKVRQTTAGATVRAKYLARDGVEKATGVRLITNMTSDWRTIAGAGHVTKGVHVLKYSVAAADKVDSTVRAARTTADSITKAEGKVSRKSVAPTSQR